MKKIILILLLFITFNSAYASSAITITGKSKVIIEGNRINGTICIDGECNVGIYRNEIMDNENNNNNNMESNNRFFSFLFSNIVDFLNTLKTEIYRKLITMAWDKQIN